jgi:hypothetical protein
MVAQLAASQEGLSYVSKYNFAVHIYISIRLYVRLIKEISFLRECLVHGHFSV